MPKVDSGPDARLLYLGRGIRKPIEGPGERRIARRTQREGILVAEFTRHHMHEGAGDGAMSRRVLLVARRKNQRGPRGIRYRQRVAVRIRQPDGMVRPPKI